MFIKLVKSNTSKNIQVYLVESYRDGKKVKHRTLKRYGVLQELEQKDPTILEKLRLEAKRLTHENEESVLSMLIDLNKSNDQSSTLKNIGSVYLSHIFDQFDLKPLLDDLSKDRKIHYSINDALKFLVLMRVLSPGSKRAAYLKKSDLYNDFDISLDDLYRSLDYFDQHKDVLLKHLDQHMTKHHQRNKTLVYYDVTNYHFESNETSDLRELGASKQNSKHPIVTMGLYIDENNYPISYDMFKGNTHDSRTLIPSLEKMKEQFDIKKCIIVADKGLNAGENIKYILDHGHGYIFASKIRGSSQKVINITLNQEGYQFIGQDFKFKQVQLKRKVIYKNEMGRTKSYEAMENTVIFHSINYDMKAKHERDKVLEKLQAYIDHPGHLKQKTKQGKFKYLKQTETNPQTGEILNPSLSLTIDETKVSKDALLDGYYLIATSEMDLKASDIIRKYRGLWQIENSFRIIKSELEGRPIYLSTDQHIKGHFFTCFMALLVTRILERKLNEKYSIDKIQEGLQKMNILEIENDVFKIMKYTQVQKAIQSSLGGIIDRTYIKKETLAKRLKELV